MSKISENVENFISPIVESLGYEIVAVEFAKKNNGDNLTVFIDKTGGITLDDCEKVHNAIDAPLDELNPTNDKPYTLNVSSPGIDRPLVLNKDFARNIGEMLEIHLYHAIFEKKVIVGKLIAFNDSSLIVEDESLNNIEIDRSAISKATKYIDF